jgi:hypothetical protein
MATIGTSATAYRKFINEFRQAFSGGVPFDADHTRANGTLTQFNYTPQVGAVVNLYCRTITTGGQARALSAAEVGYGHGNIGQLSAINFTGALEADFSPAQWPAATKTAFDIVLLCTVEAARSEFIFKQVMSMLGNRQTVAGDDLKAVAQSYAHTQGAANVAQFRPLSNIDYLALYRQNSAPGGANVNTATFQRLFV